MLEPSSETWCNNAQSRKKPPIIPQDKSNIDCYTINSQEYINVHNIHRNKFRCLLILQLKSIDTTTPRRKRPPIISRCIKHGMLSYQFSRVPKCQNLHRHKVVCLLNHQLESIGKDIQESQVTINSGILYYALNTNIFNSSIAVLHLDICPKPCNHNNHERIQQTLTEKNKI